MTIGRTFQFATVKTFAALVLGGVFLWQVGAHSGPPNGIAYVHVTTPEVDVMVDDETYHVKTLWDSPIVCELRPGKHVLRMTRNGQTLYEEEFTVKASNEVVLTAWERPADAQAKPHSP
jgi:hypothetical protein